MVDFQSRDTRRGIDDDDDEEDNAEPAASDSDTEAEHADGEQEGETADADGAESDESAEAAGQDSADEMQWGEPGGGDDATTSEADGSEADDATTSEPDASEADDAGTSEPDASEGDGAGQPVENPVEKAKAATESHHGEQASEDAVADADATGGQSADPIAEDSTGVETGESDHGEGHAGHGDDARADHDHGDAAHADHDSGHSHDHDHGHSHDHDHGQGHGAAVEQVGVAVVTISSTRTREDDPSGDVIQATLAGAGHDIVTRDVIRDDLDGIQNAVVALTDRGDVDAVVTTGGTGVTPDDVTVEAVSPLFDKELPGFGELFRILSYEDVGTKALASRATAGIVDGSVVFCLPGSEAAVRLGVEELVAEEIGHLASLAQREG